jgi:phenazine biosynthesis protein phzE
MTDLADLARSDQPFALIARSPDTVELLTGPVREVDLLADIPLRDAAGRAAEVLALVPFRQVRERGFACRDDGAPLVCLMVDEHREIERAAALAALPAEPIPVRDGGFDIDDDGYAQVVRDVIAEEIGRGEGSSFVIRRDFTATVDADPRTAALTWFRALLERERGAYWTFAVVAGDMVAVGASPEAHVRVGDGRVTMNPISGTFRHPPGGATVASLSRFLESEKET